MTFKEKINKPKVFTLLITTGIIALLFLTGPANAFTLSIGEFSETEVEKGEAIMFTVSMEINTDDFHVPVENFTLNLNGPENKVCNFDVQGNILNGCDGLTITKISEANVYTEYGYGYGYNNGNYYEFDNQTGYGNVSGQSTFKYNITLDTSNFQTGDYDVSLNTKLKLRTQTYSTFNSETQTITINTPSDITPPGPVKQLRTDSRTTNSITWKWVNPTDSDFAKNLIYIDGNKVTETSETSYKLSGLKQGQPKEITIYTEDTSGNVNTSPISNKAIACIKVCTPYSCKTYCP